MEQHRIPVYAMYSTPLMMLVPVIQLIGTNLFALHVRTRALPRLRCSVSSLAVSSCVRACVSVCRQYDMIKILLDTHNGRIKENSFTEDQLFESHLLNRRLITEAASVWKWFLAVFFTTAALFLFGERATLP